jgi:PAS domain S-box-containing protein
MKNVPWHMNPLGRLVCIAVAWLAGACIFSLIVPAADAREHPGAEQGVIDLRSWRFADNGPVPLDGQWAFYWHRFLPAGDPDRGGVEAGKPAYLRVPYVWNGQRMGAERIGGAGFATYRLRILLPPGEDPLGLHIIDAATACTVFANGRKIFGAGAPGTSRPASVPRFHPGIAELPSGQGDIDLVVHVSNYHHRQGGLWDRITIGTHEQLHAMREWRIVFNMILFGGLLMMGLYHIGLFWLRRADPSPLYFGLGCLAMSLRALTTGERYIVQAIAAFPFEWLSKIEYWGFYITVGCLALFTHSLFPKESNRRIMLGVAALSGLFSLFVLVTPLAVYSYSTPVFEGITLLGIGYGVLILGRALEKKRSGADIFLAGFLALAVAGVNDILYSRQVIHSFYMGHFGMLVFILAQAFLLSRRFSELFEVVENQQAELRASEEKYRLLVDNADEAIFIAQDNAFKFVNPRSETLFGFSREELVDLSFDACVHPDDRSGVRRHLAKVAQGGQKPVAETFRLVKPSGKTLWVQLNAVPATWAKRPAVLVFLGDVSERKQFEIQLNRAKKMEAVGTLAMGLAQDANRFIAEVLRNAERAKANLSRRTVAEPFLKKILDSCTGAQQWIEQVLMVGRKEPRDLFAVHIASEIEAVVRKLRDAVDDNIAVYADIAAREAMVLANDSQIRKILHNLADNALDAMKDRGGTLSIALHEVRVVPGSVQQTGGLVPGSYVRLSVMDTGKGIPPDIQERVFDPYFTTNAEGGRAGMGLSAVMGIVKVHKGDIGLISTPNMGTTLHVYLPTLNTASRVRGAA